jgi:hypothetical protein
MRWAKSYSIVDHLLLHGGYLRRLSVSAMSLYLFLVVVGDRDGRSFYSEVNIMEILRLPEEELAAARLQLMEEGLIDYQRPHWWVKTLEQQRRPGRPSPRPAVEAQVADRETARRHLKEIFQMLSQKGVPES